MSHAGEGTTLGRVAEVTGGRLEGGAETPVRRVAPVEEAGPEELGFLAAKGYARAAADSGAGSFLVSQGLEEYVADRPRVVVEDAHKALYALLVALHPDPAPVPGVHPTAVLGRGVTLGEDVSVGPYAVLEAGARVGDRTRIGAHSVVGEGAEVGADSLLHPHVVLYPGTRVGSRVVLHAGVRLGVDGFGWAVVDGSPRKIPQVGRCVVEDDVEIGANTTVDRGSIGETRVGAHAKLDNLVHLAHNVRLGGGSLLAAMVGIAGSTRIGRGVLMGGQAGAINHVEIGDGAQVAAATKVMRDVPAGETVAGFPARPNREHLRKEAHLARLPKLVDRVKELEARLEALEAEQGTERPGGDGG